MRFSDVRRQRGDLGSVVVLIEPGANHACVCLKKKTGGRDARTLLHQSTFAASLAFACHCAIVLREIFASRLKRLMGRK